MTKPKRTYTRAELVTQHEEPDGFVHLTCGLCGGTSLETDVIDHDDDCVLADPGVVGVTVFAMARARDVICGGCPAAAGAGNCVVPDWSLESHETLLAKCSRYAYAMEDI